jgi:hypothetical protein
MMHSNTKNWVILEYILLILNSSLLNTWSWSHDSWIYNYLCNQWLSPLKLWVRILFRQCQLFCMWKSTDPPSSIAIFHFFVLQNTKEIHVYNTWKIAYLSLRREATNFAFVSVKRRLVLSCKSLNYISVISWESKMSNFHTTLFQNSFVLVSWPHSP